MCSQIVNSVGLLRKMGSFLFSDSNNKNIVKILPQPEINNSRYLNFYHIIIIYILKFKQICNGN